MRFEPPHPSLAVPIPSHPPVVIRTRNKQTSKAFFSLRSAFLHRHVAPRFFSAPLLPQKVQDFSIKQQKKSKSTPPCKHLNGPPHLKSINALSHSGYKKSTRGHFPFLRCENAHGLIMCSRFLFSFPLLLLVTLADPSVTSMAGPTTSHSREGSA